MTFANSGYATPGNLGEMNPFRLGAYDTHRWRPPWQRAVIFLAILAMAVPVRAAVGENCNGLMTTTDRAACDRKLFSEIEARLKTKFQDIIKKPQSADFRPMIVDAESKWQAYVDAQCELDAALTKGSAEAFMDFVCKRRMYQQRYEYLNSLISALQ